MQASNADQNQFAAKAVQLIPRLEKVNDTVKRSSASSDLIETTLRVGMAYGVFLTQVQDGTSGLSSAQVLDGLARTERHCEIYESEFQVTQKGV